MTLVDVFCYVVQAIPHGRPVRPPSRRGERAVLGYAGAHAWTGTARKNFRVGPESVGRVKSDSRSKWHFTRFRLVQHDAEMSSRIAIMCNLGQRSLVICNFPLVGRSASRSAGGWVRWWVG